MKREDIVAGLRQIEKDLLEQKEQTDDALGFVRECLRVAELCDTSPLTPYGEQLKEEAEQTWEDDANDDIQLEDDLPPPLPRCAFCGEPFLPARVGKGQVFCSKKCNNAAQRAKRKELKDPPPPGAVVTTPPELKRKVDPVALAKKLADIAATCPQPVKRPDITREL